MTLATHRTQAPAARKRGGGLTHMLQDCAVATGRQQMPEGGEINSLCRAAAGIIPTLSSARAGVGHPTTGVRRAAEMGPTLRFPFRPYAQLVKGYTPHLEPLESLQGRGRKVTKLTRAIAMIPLQPRVNDQYAFEAAGNRHDVLNHIDARERHQINAFHRVQGVTPRLLHARSRALLISLLALPDLVMDQQCGGVGTLSGDLNRPDDNRLTLCGRPLLPLLLMPHLPNNCPDSAERSNRLHPGRGIASRSYREHYQVTQSENNDHPRHGRIPSDQVKDPCDRHPFIHRFCEGSRLPAFPQNVHGGAA